MSELDEAGLLTAMAYVDLNPVRAGIASTLEESQFTSIYERIRKVREPRQVEPLVKDRSPEVPLQPFHSPGTGHHTIPFGFEDYLALVNWSGRVIRDDKRGAIDARLPPIVQRLGIDPGAWELAMQPRGNVFGRALGRLDLLRLHAQTLGQSWVRGLRRAERLYV